MKFQVHSAYYYSYDQVPELLMEHLLKYCYIEDNILYINDPSLEVIAEMLESIPDECYSDSNGWKPSEVTIDTYDNTITLRDYYLE